MKKFVVIALAFLLNSFTANAANGDIIGNIYSTDILASINGISVESYCLDGKTAIILDDLIIHGADVYYNDNLRTLIVNTNYMYNMKETNVTKGKVGKIVGNIYDSDISIYLNGLKVNGFALNGKMAVAIEDIAYNNAYSPYNAKFIWDENSRTISLNFLTDNFAVFEPIDDVGYNFYSTNNNLNITINKLSHIISNNIDRQQTNTLFYNEDAVAECFDSKSAYFENDTIKINNDENSIWFDVQKISSIIKNMDKQPTYDEIMRFIEESYMPIGEIYERFDSDNYTFIYMYTSLRDGLHEHLLRIGKDGSFIKYTDKLTSVNRNGNFEFENVTINKYSETVNFQYDKDYTINLKTGELN